jgi:hypothetical protein
MVIMFLQLNVSILWPTEHDIIAVRNATLLNGYMDVVSGYTHELYVHICCDLRVGRWTWRSWRRVDQAAIIALRYATRFALEINSSTVCLGTRVRVPTCRTGRGIIGWQLWHWRRYYMPAIPFKTGTVIVYICVKTVAFCYNGERGLITWDGSKFYLATVCLSVLWTNRKPCFLQHLDVLYSRISKPYAIFAANYWCSSKVNKTSLHIFYWNFENSVTTNNSCCIQKLNIFTEAAEFYFL